MLHALAARSAVVASSVFLANARTRCRVAASSFSCPNHAWRAATFRESAVSFGSSGGRPRHVRDRLARAAGRLVGRGELGQQGAVRRPAGDELAIFDDGPLPISGCRVQTADAGNRCRMILDQPIERLLVADHVIRHGELFPRIRELRCSEAYLLPFDHSRFGANRNSKSAEILIRPIAKLVEAHVRNQFAAGCQCDRCLQAPDRSVMLPLPI